MKKGLLISVYTNPKMRKCANGGISETHDLALVIGEAVSAITGGRFYGAVPIHDREESI